MKYKTTAKAVRDGYHTIIRVGYCDLQSLLQYKNPVAYCSGTYGWNFDVYDINGVAIATGYRGIPSQNCDVKYDVIRKYEQASEGKTAEEKESLLKEFISIARGK